MKAGRSALLAKAVPFKNYLQKFIASDVLANMNTGGAQNAGISTLAVSSGGIYIILGAFAGNTASARGEINVLTNLLGTDRWVSQAIIKPTTVNFAACGCSVGVTAAGDRFVAGSFQDDTSTNFGKCYIYLRTGTTWASEKAFAPSATSGKYGQAVAISPDGTMVALANPGETTNGNGTGGNPRGMVEVWTRSGTTWTKVASLVNTSSSEGAGGSGVAISNDNKLIVQAEQFSGKLRTYFNSSGSTGGSWTEGSAQTIPAGLGSLDVMFFGGKYWIVFCSVTAGQFPLLWSSTDGTTWTAYSGSPFTAYPSNGGNANITPTGMQCAKFQYGLGRLLISYIDSGNFGSICGYNLTGGTTWNQETLMAEPFGGSASGDVYGQSIAVAPDTNYAVVGAPGVTASAKASGGVLYHLRG